MFFTQAEKQYSSFFGDWQMRMVAFDTTRRYLYYSAPLPSSVKTITEPAATPLPPPTAASGPADTSPMPSPSTGGSNSNGAARPSSSAQWPSPASVPAATTPSSAHVEDLNAGLPAAIQEVVWKKKLKVLFVVPTATRDFFDVNDPHVKENDLYQLEIHGEVRPLVTGETPPAGPLLCPSAGLISVPMRSSLNNPEYIQDPFFLRELYEALRDQFEHIAKERRHAEELARACGRPVPPPSQTQTLESPRASGQQGQVKRTIVKQVLRCRNEQEFRRLWYVLQTVLGYDKLIVRPYRGLPPYDPRNGVAFAHIPMVVWHIFEALDKAVFYVFIRGDVIDRNQKGELQSVLSGAYMCITHDMVLFMRDTGNIPRWLRLAEVSEFHANVTCAQPFIAFLSDPPARDVVFVPRPPIFGPAAIKQYDPRFDVKRVQRVMHDTCFASLSIRRVIRIREVEDASVVTYGDRMASEGRPLLLSTASVPTSALSCPLPKEQLAAVWYQVQEELRSRQDIASQAAIPIYESNAPDLQLSQPQLRTLARYLDNERERLTDVVGIPLERAQRVEAVPEPDRPRPSGRRSRRTTAPSQAAASSSSSRPARAAVAAPSAASEDTASAGASSSTGPSLPLTMELLNTPQIVGPYEAQRRQLRTRSVASSSHFSQGEVSEFSSYLVPGTHYITQEELKKPGLPCSPSQVVVDQHVEVSRTAGPAGVESPAMRSPDGSPIGGSGSGSATFTGVGQGAGRGFVYGPERTVNEIISKSIAAMDSKATRRK